LRFRLRCAKVVRSRVCAVGRGTKEAGPPAEKCFGAAWQRRRRIDGRAAISVCPAAGLGIAGGGPCLAMVENGLREARRGRAGRPGFRVGGAGTRWVMFVRPCSCPETRRPRRGGERTNGLLRERREGRSARYLRESPMGKRYSLESLKLIGGGYNVWNALIRELIKANCHC